MTNCAEKDKVFFAFSTDFSTALVHRDLVSVSNSESEPLAQEVEESCCFEAIL